MSKNKARKIDGAIMIRELQATDMAQIVTGQTDVGCAADLSSGWTSPSFQPGNHQPFLPTGVILSTTISLPRPVSLETFVVFFIDFLSLQAFLGGAVEECCKLRPTCMEPGDCEDTSTVI